MVRIEAGKAATTKVPAGKAATRASAHAQGKPAGKSAGTQRAASKAARKSAAASGSTARKTAVASKATGAGKSPARRPASTSAAARTDSTPRRISPKQALANTRKLLEAKHAHDRQPPAWQALDRQPDQLPHAAGFQSAEAQARAGELHAGESRMEAIQGAISTRDRHDQGKRDQR